MNYCKSKNWKFNISFTYASSSASFLPFLVHCPLCSDCSSLHPCFLDLTVISAALLCSSGLYAQLCFEQPENCTDLHVQPQALLCSALFCPEWHHIQHQQPSRSYYLVCNCSLPFIYLQVHSQHFQKTWPPILRSRSLKFEVVQDLW